MIKLQVLRYMGILTVMKLGVFAFSALSLLFAFTWFLFHCPVNVIYAPLSNSNENAKLNVHNARDHMIMEESINIVDFWSEDGESDNLVQSDQNSDNVIDKLQFSDQKEEENVIPRQYYKDEAFERLILELQSKNTEGYEILAKSENLTIYRRPRGKAGLYEYKLYAILPNATPQKIAAVFLDNEYRVIWDEYVTELYTVKKYDVGPDVIYFNVDFPWPLANRDYVYARETRRQIRNEDEYWTIVMNSVLRDSIPHTQGAIRVSDFHQSLVLTKHGNQGTKVYIEYFDDPKGSIPSWLVNWAAKTGVPAFLVDLQRACSGLDEFLKQKNRSMPLVPLHKD